MSNKRRNYLKCLLECSNFHRKYLNVYPKWEFSHIGLQVKNFGGLKVMYSDLLHAKTPGFPSLCSKVLGTKYATLCQYVLRKGQTPRLLRGEFWSYVLASDQIVGAKNQISFNRILISIWRKYSG